METDNALRHQIIKNLMARRTEKVAYAAVEVWEQMAKQIIAIVGQGGFDALYARSVYLTQPTVPWLAAGVQSPRTEQRFAELILCFDGKDPTQIREANALLLIRFTDILSTLVGEQLTTKILRSAWGTDTPGETGKELKNE